MSKIEKLIAELCPRGVELKELREIGTLIRGNGLQKKDFVEDGVGCIHYGQIYTYYGTFADKTKTFVSAELARRLKKAQKGDVLISGVSENIEDVCKPLGWLGGEICISGDMFAFRHNQDTKFITYLLQTPDFKRYKARFALGAKVIRVRQDKILDYKIPIPPLPIQQEIVKILDNFAKLEAELGAELEAELQARKKQYEHYRENLFAFGEETEKKSLGDVGEFIRGKRFVRNDITQEGVPCIHYGELYTHYKTWARESKSYLEPILAAKLRTAKTNDVIIVAAGETIEDIGNGVAWLGESDIVIHDACFAFRHNLNPKYVAYYLQTNSFRSQIKRFISSGKISSINAAGLSKAIIPIPPIAEQERVVTILDKFDSLVNDLSDDLPAEMNARRKQYEYYRSQLLAFTPLNKENAN